MQGMVLCGVSKDHSVVKLLQAPEGATVGARVTFPGFTTNGEPASSSQMAKKKILEGLAPLVRTIFVNFSTHFFRFLFCLFFSLLFIRSFARMALALRTGTRVLSPLPGLGYARYQGLPMLLSRKLAKD
jgi:hypothetical protein